MISLGVNLFEIIVLGISWASWLCRFFFKNSGKEIYWHYFFEYSLALFSFWESIMFMLVQLMVSHSFLKLCLLQFLPIPQTGLSK